MVKKIKHNDKEVLVVDYGDCKNEDEMVKSLLQAQETIISDNKPYLQLTSLQGAYPTFNFMKKAKQVAKETPKLAVKRAIVGIDSPSRKILLRGYNMIIGGKGLEPFDSEKDALDWLTKE